MLQRTVSQKPYNLKYLKQSRRKSKRISKRIKREDKFHYDLDKLKFTMGRIDPLNLNRLKKYKKSRIRDAKREEERKRREEEEERKRREEKKERERKEEEEERERKEEGFQKASPEDLAYRDLFVKTNSLEKEEICSICLRHFKQKFTWKLSCNHHFHYDCIEQWSNMERYTCPLCRQEYNHP